MTKRVRRAAAVMGLAGALVGMLVGVLVGLFASPAFAHATLIESSPQPGEVLQRGPRVVTLRFNESVEASLGAVRAYDRSGERIATGDAEQPLSDTVTAALPDLVNGVYVVTWRVTSVDSHPLAGTFTFQVGDAGNATGRESQQLAQRLLADQGGDRVVGALFGVTRGVVFGGLALLLGGAVFAALIWPRARRSVRARRLVWVGWGATTAATALGLLLQGPYAEARPLGDVFDLALLGDVLGTRFGEVWLFRLLLLMVAIPLLRHLFGRTPEPRHGQSSHAESGTLEATRVDVPDGWPAAAAVVAIALAATPGLSGHAVAGDWIPLAIVADTVHVLAMAVWLGGLVLLAAVVLPHREADELRGVAPRFSRVALGCIAALVVTGSFQAWRQVGSLDALGTTDYGRILLVKLGVFAVVVVGAVFSRGIVARLFPRPHRSGRDVPVVAGGADDWAGTNPDEAIELRDLRRSVAAEIMFAAAVLAATALLVNAVPAKTAAGSSATSGAVGVTLKSSEVWVDVTVAPGSAGRNDLHVSVLQPAGPPRAVPELKLTIDLPSKQIAPLDVPLRLLGPGHYLSPGFEIPFSGEWRFTARPRLDDLNQPVLAGTVAIR